MSNDLSSNNINLELTELEEPKPDGKKTNSRRS